MRPCLLIAQGEHPKVIQARLGHESIRMTLDVYGHLVDAIDEAAADRLDEAFAVVSADSLADHMRTADGSSVVSLRP
jgi:hypothetical protein